MQETNTIREIFHQPTMWIKEHQLIYNNKERIKSFLSKRMGSDVEIILTGAGTSAFIGGILTYLLPLKSYKHFKAVATTDLITHPERFLSKEKDVVLVSFARSGNSPESLEAVKLANSHAKNAYHIIITCNNDGELSKGIKDDNSLLLLLPPETNDKGLAMTSSFTTMMLAFILLINIDDIDAQEQRVQALSRSAEKVFEQYLAAIEKLSSLDFKRAVFLGSGELKGIAEECHLKLQELTDGAVVCKNDSFLGFRHGPKAVINEDTLLIYLFSADEKVRKYEYDLVKQINANNQLVAQIAVSLNEATKIEGVDFDLDMVIDYPIKGQDFYAFIPYVIIGQLLGYYKSIDLGLDPDKPSVSGNIARVVEGVTIY